MSDVQPSIGILERCLESLAFCHRQDELRWAAARIVAQQDIDEFMRDGGTGLAGQHEALALLMAEFDRMFPDGSDPVLIRSYVRRQMRRISYDIKHGHERASAVETLSEPVAPATAPTEADCDMEAANEAQVTEPQAATEH